MAARRIVSRDVKCYLCSEVTARIVRSADAPAARPQVVLSAHLPAGPRFVNKRLVCGFCGGSLFLDGLEEQLVETQREYPRERRGRPPGSGRRNVESAGA